MDFSFLWLQKSNTFLSFFFFSFFLSSSPMLAISYKTNFNLSNLEVDKIIQVGLVNASQRVQKVAQANAPYETGKLKQGIGVEPNNIGKGVKQVRV